MVIRRRRDRHGSYTCSYSCALHLVCLQPGLNLGSLCKRHHPLLCLRTSATHDAMVHFYTKLVTCTDSQASSTTAWKYQCSSTNPSASGASPTPCKILFTIYIVYIALNTNFSLFRPTFIYMIVDLLSQFEELRSGDSCYVEALGELMLKWVCNTFTSCDIKINALQLLCTIHFLNIVHTYYHYQHPKIYTVKDSGALC